jgi:hypothetical protein
VKEDELKIELAQRRNLSELAWQYLRERGYVEAAVEEIGQAAPDPVAYLVGEFDAAASAFAAIVPATPEPSEPSDIGDRSSAHDQQMTPVVGSYEGLRASVLSEYLTKTAAMVEDVARFRREILNNGLLDPEEARAFFSSPAARYLGHGTWQAYGIPAKHTATLLDENYGRTEDGPFHWV